MKVFLSHSGKQHSYFVAQNLEELDSLYQFHTSSYVKSSFVKWLSNNKYGSFFKRRYNPNLSSNLVRSNWQFEIPEMIQRKLQGRNNKSDELVFNRDVKFDKYISEILPNSGFDLFWGFQGSCEKSVLRANELGKISVCELATAHVTSALQILGEEEKIQPDWASTINNLKFPEGYITRLNNEIINAQKVVAASEFTRKSLLDFGIPANKIEKIPLGVDISEVKYKKKDFSDFENRPLRILFSGAATQRKGISYLIDAAKRFNKTDVELHVIGAITGENNPILKELDWINYHGSVSQNEMFKLYHQFDILILPSLFEGFGLVIVEALAAGLPVVATKNTMAPDVIVENENGVIVPIRNIESIGKAIEFYKNLNPIEMEAQSLNARESAMNFSWKNHKKQLASFLKRIE